MQLNVNNSVGQIEKIVLVMASGASVESAVRVSEFNYEHKTQ